jgi:hypothetical protein
MIRPEALHKPHNLYVPCAFLFKVSRGPDLIQVTVNEKPEQITRMISRATIFDKVQSESIIFNGETFDKNVYNPDFIFGIDYLIQ